MSPVLQAIFAATASFFVVTIIFASIKMICRGTKIQWQSPRPDVKDRDRNQNRNPNRTVPVVGHHSSADFGESASFDPSLSRVSMSELLRATHNFSPDLIIGDGSFGLVYKALLSSGDTVAVKKLDPDAFQGFREFRAEMETLSKIRHDNIVKILGFCAVGMDRILIYEFAEKGSLDQWLYDTSSSDNGDVDTSLTSQRLRLSWPTRIGIIKGVAKGLAYMHTLETPIIHRDIKSSNVLLDSKFGAHIADFGLARSIERSHSHVSTQVAGTMGYMPPEYVYGITMATVMGDVYSFGILMLEIMIAQRPNWPFVGEDGKEIGLTHWVKTLTEQKRHMDMIDTGISRDGLKESTVIEYFRLAILCINENYKDRPTMMEVVELLNGIP